MLDNNDENLRAKVLYDLTNRAKAGIALYAIIWLITMLWAEIHIKQPFFFYFNTSIIFMLALVRLGHYFLLMRDPQKNVLLMSRVLIIAILASGLHWGLVTAWIVNLPNYDQLYYVYIIIMTAFAMGGTATLGISKEIRNFYPYFSLAPSILTAIVVTNSENKLLVVIGLCALTYIVFSAKHAAQDYWDAIHNLYLADNRAVLMEELSVTDPLTKLKNRLYFNNQYTKEWHRCSRDKVPITVLMIDLDHFKKVNDT
jgi:predicted signal transduction protein with EAL and GGDEF domain